VIVVFFRLLVLPFCSSLINHHLVIFIECRLFTAGNLHLDLHALCCYIHEAFKFSRKHRHLSEVPDVIFCKKRKQPPSSPVLCLPDVWRGIKHVENNMSFLGIFGQHCQSLIHGTEKLPSEMMMVLESLLRELCDCHQVDAADCHE